MTTSGLQELGLDESNGRLSLKRNVNPLRSFIPVFSMVAVVGGGSDNVGFAGTEISIV